MGLNPYVNAGYAGGAILGGGLSYSTGNAIYSINYTHAAGLVNTFTLQVEHPDYGTIGISGIMIGGLFIPLPFALADVTKPTNKMLYYLGLRDKDVEKGVLAGNLGLFRPAKVKGPGTEGAE